MKTEEFLESVTLSHPTLKPLTAESSQSAKNMDNQEAADIVSQNVVSNFIRGKPNIGCSPKAQEPREFWQRNINNVEMAIEESNTNSDAKKSHRKSVTI